LSPPLFAISRLPNVKSAAPVAVCIMQKTVSPETPGAGATPGILRHNEYWANRPCCAGTRLRFC
jgi:hypothetical protein